MSWSAIIAGAGSGSRLGANYPKALVTLGGIPLIVHATQTMIKAGVNECVVTTPSGYEDQFQEIFDHYQLPARIVTGGQTRQDSVARALKSVTHSSVLVHDAARALTPVEIISRVMAAVERGAQAVIPVLPVIDTIKSVTETNIVESTLQRSQLRAVQTPQGFSTELLRQAHADGAKLSQSEQSAAPDDAALIERMGIDVVVVDGSINAMKITTPLDLTLAEHIYRTLHNAPSEEL
ncbi:2-C-methyl-D-erythritol 4-phosphate cytidylyltransferase [Arcanobacterium buesumense]|uniref:2-C-methyl-D-erythritol 4-phosphate cytidylyltransferase n=1 Tax=Arcanobacterium buesumense TaxID=2722751 RepID=A0A6H2EN30_9ACTO|nr:2-C-methyl-D-erythritol 4-phosphate cytidylyltransferase [Arcanobacterium buesumense]QJC22485.1 2-C-methyl-D-erythritol 4-phosphate cytidylyltransferase [Arcanobacterium buesumense]